MVRPGGRRRAAARLLRGRGRLLSGAPHPGGVGHLALLSDCRTAAIVDRDGQVGWWPGPRFDGPSVFTALLDADAGRFAIAPVPTPAQTTRAYLPGTLVLRTEHRLDDGGTLVVTDALALAPGARGHEIGHASPGALIRVLEAVGGDVDVQIDLVPRPEYGLAVPRVVRDGGQLATIGGSERLFVTDGGLLEPDGGTANARLTLRAGERRGIVVRRGDGIGADSPAPLDPFGALEDTIAAWRSWSALHDGYDGPYREQVLRGALVLQGLTFQPSGAVVAAPTTSLPEVAGGDANWDYRFGWLRDASLVARALMDATCADEARRYFAWMARAAVSCRHASHVQILFGVEGERMLEESVLDHLDGYAGSSPVRIGNAAWRQKQLDVLGEVLDVALALGDDLDEELDDFTAGFLCELADRAAEQWREPDAGMWEVRDREEHHTVSRVMCWVALDRAVRLAPKLGDHADPERWVRVRDEVREAVLEQAWSEERGAFVGTLGGDRLDAAVLHLALTGLLGADDPRMRATADALEAALGDHGLLRRHEDLPDGGAFLPATFWLASYRALAGELDAARATFDAGAACANDLGLLAEMADGATRTPLGNVPQALSHVALITAAQHLADAERTAGREAAHAA